uniref:GntR family transcriptional regulator n=1 Tax=uncultured Sphingomonas sp. TaxID=158754 RepID=UPI0035C94469
MNAGPTAERAYDVLKRRVLSGEFRPGERLEPGSLGEPLGISATPVRDALYVLAGEGLIETRTSEGFYMPQESERGLRDLYGWNAEVLLIAISNWSRDPADAPASAWPPVSAGELEAAQLFDWVAERSANREHRRAIASNSDRLRAARRAESRVIEGAAFELRGLVEAMTTGDRARLRLLLNAYHRRRVRHVADIVDAIRRQ